MADFLFTQRKLLKEYLDNVYQAYPSNALKDLEKKDPPYYAHIRACEHEYARLTDCAQQAQAQQAPLPNISKAQQLTLSLFPAALPTPPKQTIKQQLQGSTTFTPLPSIVSAGFNKAHTGINWPHYENMLKLFALGYLYHGKLTQQQQKDKDDLTQAIEEVGNAKFKKKHLTAEEITERDSRVYMRYGQNVIRAMADPDPLVSERRLKDLRSEIPDTRNNNNATQLHKMMSKAKTIAMILQNRYKSQ